MYTYTEKQTYRVVKSSRKSARVHRVVVERRPLLGIANVDGTCHLLSDRSETQLVRCEGLRALNRMAWGV